MGLTKCIGTRFYIIIKQCLSNIWQYVLKLVCTSLEIKSSVDLQAWLSLKHLIFLNGEALLNEV